MSGIWNVSIGKEDGAVPFASEQKKETYLQVLEAMDRNMSDICREVERGNTFYPYWPMWDNQSEKLTVIPTDEVYLYLQQFRDVGYCPQSGGVFYAVPESVNVDRDIARISATTEYIPDSVREVEKLVNHMPSTILRGLIAITEKNETERVMIPIVDLSRQMRCYVIEKINLLNMLLAAYYSRLD